MLNTTSRRRVLIGLIGSGIQKSLSPALHEAEGDAHGLRYQYQLLDLNVLRATPADLPQLLHAAQRVNFNGLNITHPCKQLVLAHLDELTADARALGAVNTVVFENGRRVGHNTDWWGFAESFRRGLPGVARRHVVQLGAGGAGRAVAHAALTLGVETLTIFDVDAGRAERLADALSARFGVGRAVAGHSVSVSMADADGLIHATPTGMAEHPGLPLPAELLHAGLWVAEIVYFPLETELLKVARAKGCATLDGGGMAVFQAAQAFQLFTGVTPDAERMMRHFALLQASLQRERA